MSIATVKEVFLGHGSQLDLNPQGTIRLLLQTYDELVVHRVISPKPVCAHPRESL